MPNFIARSIALFIVIMLLTGCEMLQVKDRQDTLDKSLRAYEAAMRWSHIYQAYSLHKPEKIKELKIPQGLDNIKVTRYKVLEPAVNDIKSDVARQVVLISYVEKDRQQEKSITDHQLWEYDRSARRWHLISDIPAFITEPKMRILPLDK